MSASKSKSLDGEALGRTVVTKLAEVKKLVVSVAGFSSTLLAMGVLPSPVDIYVTAGLGFLSSVGVYKTRNASRG